MNIKFKLNDEVIKVSGNLYHVSGTFNACVDRNYGADADNNRGEVATWIDEFELDTFLKDDTNILDDHSDKDLDNILGYLENHIDKYI